MKNAISILTIVLLAVGSAAPAQETVPPDIPVDEAFVVGGGYGGYRAGYHASTAFEGAARGFADYMRSQGQFNLSTAEAAVAASQARQQEIDNYQQWVDAYHNTRRKIREYRAAERRPRATAEDLIRYAQRARPDRPSPSELDALTGRVSWPVLLRHEAFAEHRTALGELFQKRAMDRHLQTEHYLAIQEAIDAFESELKSRVRQLPLQDYASAKRFLRSLDYEAQLPVGLNSRLAATVDGDAPPVPGFVP
jgi:hypothetical protein